MGLYWNIDSPHDNNKRPVRKGKESQKITKESQKLMTIIDELSQANRDNLDAQNKIAELSKSILLLEETVRAFDAYRRQNNEMLQEMQLKISSMESPTSP